MNKCRLKILTIQKELTGDTGNYYLCMLPNLTDMNKIKILSGTLIRLSNCCNIQKHHFVFNISYLYSVKAILYSIIHISVNIFSKYHTSE